MNKLIALLLAVCIGCCAAPPKPPLLRLTHVTSFVVYPPDTNHIGTLFGGKILAEMDRCAGVTTRRLLYASAVKDAVTVGITDVKFHRPGQVKDLIFVSGEVVELGSKSVTVHVKVEREVGEERELLAEGRFTFVAYDVDKRKAVEHGLKLK